MSKFLKLKLTLAVSTLALGASFASAQEATAPKANYIPADPDKYPYHGLTKDKQGRTINVDGAIVRPAVEGDLINHNQAEIKRNQIKFGVDATKEQIDGWNVDVRPDGKGLPPGKMTVEEGSEVFAKNCAMCHGDFGEGAGKNLF